MEQELTGPAVSDAFGEALLVQLDGGAATIVYERDDGFVDSDTGDYFLPPEYWDETDRWCLDQIEGHVPRSERGSAIWRPTGSTCCGCRPTTSTRSLGHLDGTSPMYGPA